MSAPPPDLAELTERPPKMPGWVKGIALAAVLVLATLLMLHLAGTTPRH